MRRSASEVIRNLEQRIARLERQADTGPSMELSHFIESELEDMGIEFIEMESAKACKKGGYCYFIWEETGKACAIIHEDDRGDQELIKVWISGAHEHDGDERVKRQFDSLTTGRELL
jgi:hypothetical protein